ncbi:MAG: DUF3034 family protein [Micropepsaceae bacterium]
MRPQRAAPRWRLIAGFLLALALPVGGARAESPQKEEAPATTPGLFDSGKLLATGGVSQLEGAGGGGLTPWALIAGYGTQDSIGANVHYTIVAVDDYNLQSAGVAIGLFDRLELSYARHEFDTQSKGAALGLRKGYTFGQDIWGAKLRLAGDAVYDQDTWLPQIAVGAQWKIADHAAVLAAVGARDHTGVDYYLAATKVLLDESLLLNGTVRLTKANQTGLLGFGGDRDDGYSVELEGSAAVLLSRHFAIGIEYRSKPDNLAFAKEDDWADLFVAWFPTKNVSVTAAYVELGDVATSRNQRGIYLSAQVGL